jgi:hypothetical protein
MRKMHHNTQNSPNKNLKPSNFAHGRNFAPKIIYGANRGNKRGIIYGAKWGTISSTLNGAQFSALNGALFLALKGALFPALNGVQFLALNGAQFLTLLEPKFYGWRKNTINSSILIKSAIFFKKMKKNTLKPTLEEKMRVNHRDLL